MTKTAAAPVGTTRKTLLHQMKTLCQPLFLLCFILALANQLLELAGIYIWPLHTHLDDLLVLPIALTFALAAERLYFNKPYFTLPFSYTLLALLLFCVVFEGVLPLLHPRYTADAWDTLAYAMGAIFFHASINKPLEEKQA